MIKQRFKTEQSFFKSITNQGAERRRAFKKHALPLFVEGEASAKISVFQDGITLQFTPSNL